MDEEVVVKWEDIELQGKVGSGKYGQVYRGRCRGGPVAVKLLDAEKVEEKQLEELRDEVEILRKIRNPHVCLFMGVCLEKGHISIVMEFVNGTSLESMLESRTPPSLAKFLKIASDVATGCNWLHHLEPSVLHRDLKPANILVDTLGNAKVCDFGLSCFYEKPPEDKEVELADTAVGTPVWMAPEVLSGYPNTDKSDIYAFGVILWQLVTLQVPWATETSYRDFLKKLILEEMRPPIPDDCLPSLSALIQACWAPKPEDRPSFDAVIERLPQVYMDTCIKDEAGQTVWANLKNKSKGHWPFEVEFKSFLVAFQEHLGCESDLPPMIVDPIKILLATTDPGSVMGADHQIVKCEDWGKFLGWFGPLDDTLPAYVLKLCKSDWFHGKISSHEAERRLLKDKPRTGTFLIRLSESGFRCYTVSRVSSGTKRTVVHHRVYRRADARGFKIEVDGKLKKYRTLVEAVDGLKKKFGLKKACLGSELLTPTGASEYADDVSGR